MLSFVVRNARWLGAGFLLTFASAFGQTWCIALFADAIKAEYGLSDGAWGSLYTAATLSAAGLMFARGGLADTVPFARLAPLTALVFAGAALAVAFGESVLVLGVALFLLRFCGQGMFSHIAMTAMGRWFDAQRGRAVSVVSLGYSAAETTVPFLVVASIAAVGWHQAWVGAAAILAFAVAPALAVLLRGGRTPHGHAETVDRAGLGGRHWTRGDAVRHWLLPALLPVILTPGFIGTVVFFQQVNVADTKRWDLAAMAAGYPAYAGMAVAASLVSGWCADRWGPHRLLPLLFVPMGLSMATVAAAGDVAGWWLALALLGLSQGSAAALWGALLPAVYGTRHLGAVRSLVTTTMVGSTALGPGATGLLIDAGVPFPSQAPAFAAWCAALVVACTLVERRLTRELRA